MSTLSDMTLTTIVQDIILEPDEVQGVKGIMISRKMSVDEVSFGAHVDYQQNSEFIELIGAPHVVSTLSY